MKKILAALLLISFFFAACEKDDICDPATPTTPRLIIQFYDKNNVSLTRFTTNLKIIADGFEEDNFLPNPSGGETWNDTLLYLPLRINKNTTKYKLILNSDTNPNTTEQIDFLEINYTKDDFYISRACGFKTQYNLFGDPLRDPIVLNNTPNIVTGNWINDIEILQSQINDENEAHIKIFF